MDQDLWVPNWIEIGNVYMRGYFIFGLIMREPWLDSPPVSLNEQKGKITGKPGGGCDACDMGMVRGQLYRYVP